ncbi:MAG: hypothetical protein A2Y21_03785 [Clostridiales bacterium GWC2_40_7]|nr:MAG: hypothetical protein A2Y21_03785 [Clostridiales bacterium GWC2_40_7]
MSYILTLDVGTTSVKTCIFNEVFKLLGYSCSEYTLLTQGNNMVELDSEVYWETSKYGIKKAIEASSINAKDIGSITITSQGETLIPVDEFGKPLRNAIVWLDARAEEEAEFIRRGFSSKEIYETTGIPEISSACPVCKVLWIKDKEPEIYEKTYRFMLLEDLLIQKITGRFVTEKCLMSSTGYFDINQGVLWKKILSYAGINVDKFPEIMDCGKVVGKILPDVAENLCINSGLVVTTGAMDQAASAIGAGNIDIGVVTETTGTALVVAATVDVPDYSNTAMLNIMRHGIEGKFLILPYNQTSGIILKWFKDEFCWNEIEMCNLCGKSVYDCLDELAAGVSALSNGLLLLPHFAGMLTPEINPSVKGVFFGVGLDTKKPHFIRSILEGIAYMLKQNLDMLEDMGIEVKEIRSLGGGSKSGLWSQIKADVNNCNIQIMEQEESTSLGAAILGSMAMGIYNSFMEACMVVRVKKSFKPDNQITDAYSQGYEKYMKLYECLKSLF